MSQIKLVVFDMDGTIIEPRSSWAMIHDYFGTDNTEMLQMYIDHKISDKELGEISSINEQITEFEIRNSFLPIIELILVNNFHLYF